jgi:hypothetical protein
VNGFTRPGHGDLDAANIAHAELASGFHGFSLTAQLVVIGQRHDLHTIAVRTLH